MPGTKQVCEVCNSGSNYLFVCCVVLYYHIDACALTVIRGLAVGTVREDNVRSLLWSEMRIGICLSLILGVVGFVRAAVFLTPLAETLAITVR